MQSTEPDFTDPAWQPYLTMLGAQAAALAAELPVPADLEASWEAVVQYVGAIAPQLAAITRHVRALEARKAAGTWTDADEARREQLQAWLVELHVKLDAMRETLVAAGMRHGLLPPP